MKKNISILGSTGSIGVSTIDLVVRHPDKFKVIGLAAGSNVDVLVSQIEKVLPRVVSVKDKKTADELSKKIKSKVEILFGEEGAIAIASLSDVEFVVSAIVGAAGLNPTLAALKHGKVVGLANKESMVIAGEIMRREIPFDSQKIIPIDSEHSALFQCLQGQKIENVNKMILTASGGPFRTWPLEDFKKITKAQALKHPNWDMGAKITIDSATMMNKGLEVMEARWLFDMTVDKIEVCVHPQSIVHSMVEYCDGSVMAQLGSPDMRVPIAYALSYPERIETGAQKLNLFEKRELSFFEPDLIKFPALKLAFEVGAKGQTYPAVLNAANEIAVEAFLQEKISFVSIADCVERTLAKHSPKPLDSIADVIEADRWAREVASQILG